MTHIIHPEIIERLGNLNLLFRIKEGIGKLFPFSQSTLNDLKPRDIAQEVAHMPIPIIPLIGMRILLSVHSCETRVS
jgi:hypothetical protein